MRNVLKRFRAFMVKIQEKLEIKLKEIEQEIENEK